MANGVVNSECWVRIFLFRIFTMEIILWPKYAFYSRRIEQGGLFCLELKISNAYLIKTERTE